MSLPSRIVVGLTATERSVKLRRANFLELLDGMRNLGAVRPLFEQLPDDVTLHVPLAHQGPGQVVQ
jgi:hypothetical protein